jgi:hypothetical protein
MQYRILRCRSFIAAGPGRGGAVTSFLWLVGFADQLPDVEQTVKYVGISLLMLAVAAMA